MRYYRSGNVLWTVFTLLEILIPGIWAFSGWSARLRTLAQRIGRRWFFTIAVYYVLFTLITFLVMLPLDYYAGFVRQHAYGMSNQSLLKWAEDTLEAARTESAGRVSGALDSLRVSGPGSTEVVALYGPVGPAAVGAGDADPADLDRSALQPLRSRSRTGGWKRRLWPCAAGGDRARPHLRGRQERRYQRRKRLRTGLWGYAADRSLGYAAGTTSTSRS